MSNYRSTSSSLSLVLAAFLLLAGIIVAQDEAATAAAAEGERVEGPALQPDTNYYAAMTTTQGLIVIDFYEDVAPKTVRNFVNLAEGTRPWLNPRSNRNSKSPFYDGLTFHRIIQGFMIQGGCPLGNGRGGPGYRFEDEVTETVTFNEKDYLLAMANSGANTNGSQFFITDKGSNPSHLNMRHTIFGEVIHGKDVVDAIAAVEKGPQDRPVTPVIIRHVQIIRTAAGAEADAWKSEVLAIPTDTPYDPSEEYSKSDLAGGIVEDVKDAADSAADAASDAAESASEAINSILP
jgi:peptidyl-prolyl cis-trans isomerase A (cyclophilin A)